jgi:endonuclease/exonuclease/phosphatase (EEP) superfamily protein YafD
MHVAGDRWWPATMLLFGPRWLVSLPLLLLIPLAIRYCRRLLLPLAIAALIIAGPFMHFTIPLGRVVNANSSGGYKLRVLTCNVDQAVYDRAEFIRIIKDMSVDIVALQEFPAETKLSLPVGWNMVATSGYAIMSRFPLLTVKTVSVKRPKETWAFTCLLHAIVHTPNGEIDVCSIQLPTPRVGLQHILDRHTGVRPSRSGLLYEETAFRYSVALEARRYIETLSRPVIIAGDFNTPVDSTLYRSVWNDFINTFSEAGSGYGWTQRVAVGGFSYSARIDHILIQKGLSPLLSVVGPDLGSDHLPVISDVLMPKSLQ